MKIKIITIIFAIATLTGCGKLGLYNQYRGEVMASVEDRKLYSKDVYSLMSDGMSHEDSVAFVEGYVKNWIKNEVKFITAEKALSADEAVIKELVNQYRRSLITYKYEDEIVAGQMDTVVTKTQINTYYSENKEGFRLAGPIVKGAVVRLPKQLRMGDKFEELFRRSSENSRAEFQAICQKNGYSYNDYIDTWTDFSVVVSHLPFNDSNFDEFLKSKKYFETEDEDYKYLMKIVESRASGDYAPVELHETTIRKIILNTRRVEIIREMEDNLVETAQKNKKIHINRQ